MATREPEWPESLRNWKFTTKQREDDIWEASLEIRKIVFEEPTRDQAIASMLYGYCIMAREGQFNPKQPERIGVPPIQHAIEILEEQLNWHIVRRFEDWREVATHEHTVVEAGEEKTTAGSVTARSPQMTRRNEVIGGIATAIAALSRIKEL